MQTTPSRPRRTRFAIFAAALALLSVAVELILHLCAELFFDPLPDSISMAAYLFLPASLFYSEFALGTVLRSQSGGQRDGRGRFLRKESSRRHTITALLLSGLAVGVSGVFTVLFLPLLPLAAFPLTWVWFGFCGLSPVLSFGVILSQFCCLLRRTAELGIEPRRGIRAGAFAVIIAAVPATMGRPLAIGYFFQRAADIPGEREAAVGWLRVLDARDEVLNLCYRGRSGAWIWSGRRIAGVSTDAETIPSARKIYFLMTGHPYESAEAPRIHTGFLGGRRRDSARWEEQGGELVGHTIPGLSLGSSRIDGVLDPEQETAYAEWTLVFRNATDQPQEARCDLLLPEGGVVDKVSLWINGEERPAAFGPRSVVREAYRQVAVVQQRDPLLVTAKDTGHVLAQCFPVPAKGEMKIRLGMSAPLTWEAGERPALRWAPPVLQQVNFRIPADLQHEVWMEGRWQQGTLAGLGWEITQKAEGGKEPVRTARVRLAGPEAAHAGPLVVVGVRPPKPGDAPAPGLVRRRSPFAASSKPVDLLVVVDPTPDLKKASQPTGEAWILTSNVFDFLPEGSRVRLVDTRTLSRTDGRGGTGWLERRDAEKLALWLRGLKFDGGVEPGPALARAWDEAASSRNRGAVLWLHGPTPEMLVDPEPLRQRMERRPDGPVLVGLRVRPGSDTLMDALAGHPRVFALASSGDYRAVQRAAALAASLPERSSGGDIVPLGGREPAINGLYVDPAAFAAVPADARTTPAQRLAVNSLVLDRWYRGAKKGKRLEEAQKLAIRRRLVTPITGAVVLETKQQYDQHGLDADPSEQSIPSVPEPGTLAMLLVAGGAAGASALKRRRQRKQVA